MTRNKMNLLLSFFICILPLALLFSIHKSYADWFVHVWQIAYFSEYFKHFLSFPEVINAAQISGIVSTIFYGDIFYSVGGLLSSVLGADLGVRCVIFGTLMIQFVYIRKVFLRLTSDHLFATTVAALVTWEIYPLTNLYNRGALTEFIAVCFLQSALCCLLILNLGVQGRERIATFFGFSLFFTFSATTHPITGMMGGLYLGVLGLGCLFFSQSRSQLFLSLAAAGAILIAVLLPWFYVLVLFLKKLPIAGSAGLAFYPFDTFLSRLMPFPYDSRSVLNGIQNLSVAYVETQIDIPLFLMALFLTVLVFRKGMIRQSQKYPFYFFVVVLSFMMGVATFCASVFPTFASWMPTFINKFQIANRLVTYQNLSILLFTFGIAGFFSKPGAFVKKSQLQVVCAIVLSLSISSVMTKLVHARVIASSTQGLWRTSSEIINLPGVGYNSTDYAVNDHIPLLVSKELLPQISREFHIQTGRRFGEPEVMHLDLVRPTLLLLNLHPFPWNKLFLDGKETDSKTLYRHSLKPELEVSEGQHSVEYRFVPDPTWRLLRAFSHLIFFVVSLAWVLSTLILRRSVGHVY
jgi:hypothetical protein